MKNLLERIMFLPMRVRVRARSRSRYKVRAQALAATRRTLDRLTKLSAHSHMIVFNVGLYLLLLDQDLADFTDDLVCATGDRRRAFIAKREAILLCEAAQDLTHLLGREFRAAVEALGTSEVQLGRLNAVSSDLNEFWQKHREFLGTIRKALAAHREQNARCYLESLEQIKPLEVMARAAELSGHLERLLRVLTEITLGASGPGSILRDMVESGKKRQPG